MIKVVNNCTFCLNKKKHELNLISFLISSIGLYQEEYQEENLRRF